jgi:hypothetical protein
MVCGDDDDEAKRYLLTCTRFEVLGLRKWIEEYRSWRRKRWRLLHGEAESKVSRLLAQLIVFWA